MKNVFMFFILLPAILCAQSKNIEGTIKDGNGIPLPGVNILVKGSKNLGVTSDFDGNFSISIPSSNQNNILIFSYLGYKSQEIDVTNKSIVNITMIEDQTQLDEVVVVGYGSVLKKDISGAITSVVVEENVANQSTSIDQLLQGRAAGVQVTQNAGAPGSGVSVKIRGTNSLRGNNEPLYVVDGVIISSAGEDVLPAGGVNNSGQEVQNGLSGINPRDIEDIQILKDASATAIYGSRGANGVVLITTKKGKQGKAQISGFMQTSVVNIDKKIDVLDGVGYAEYQNEIAGETIYEFNGNNIVALQSVVTGQVFDEPLPVRQIDWQDEVYTQGFNTKAGLSFSGGSDTGQYYVSAGFNDQKGIVSNSSYKALDFRLNLDQKLTKNLELKARVSGYFHKTDFAEGGDLVGRNESFVRNTLLFRPIIVNGVEEDLTQDLEVSNPFSWINDFDDLAESKRYIGSLGLTYKLPVEGLSYEINAGGNVRTKDRRRFYGLTTFQGAAGNGALQISTFDNTSFQVNNLLKFNRTFNDKHRINATFGTTYDVKQIENSIYAVANFVTTEFRTQQPFYAQDITQPMTKVIREEQVFSLLGRFNYTFDDKYILTASFRRDAVSKFRENNRVGFFPSFAAAWRLGNESFIKDLGVFDNLKLRAGWGQIGNHGIGPYATISDYGPDGSLYGAPGNGTSIPFYINNVANPDLKWETTEQLNVGLDFETKNNKVSGTVDLYNKTTKDLLLRASLPLSSGFGSIIVNRGNISNKGVELSLNFNPISTKDFEINFGGNIAFNKTTVESLGYVPKPFWIDGVEQQKSFYFGNEITRSSLGNVPANVFIDGEEMGLFYGFETNGIYQTEDTDLVDGAQAGDVRIIDQNGDGVIDINDRTFIGNPNPDFIYGLNLDMKFKRFTANVLFNGVYGNDIANANLISLNNARGEIQSIAPAAYYNAWRPDAQTNTYPRIGYRTEGLGAITDRIIEDGSFLRLSNVTLGYDIPINSSMISGLKVFVSGQNLVTWTNYSGYNPEISSFLYDGSRQGIDWNGAPNAKSFLLGLNINF
jgi:TonB-linked SusC/RagA family outer membrane protein